MDFAASVVAIIEAMRRFACRLALPHLRTGLIAFEPSRPPRRLRGVSVNFSATIRTSAFRNQIRCCRSWPETFFGNEERHDKLQLRCVGSNPAAPSGESSRILILRCRGSNPAAPTGQSESNPRPSYRLHRSCRGGRFLVDILHLVTVPTTRTDHQRSCVGSAMRSKCRIMAPFRPKGPRLRVRKLPRTSNSGVPSLRGRFWCLVFRRAAHARSSSL